MVGSAEIGTKVLNDAELRAKYLDAEHKGVKVLLLLTHQPGNIHTTKKPIRTADDMKGLRIRFSSPTIRDFVAALGGTAVGVQPTEQLEQLTAARASRSRWAARSSTRPRCTPTSLPSAWR
jgi:TRAP-type C4-dicarboxylate transport system substrate-binding protein